MKKKISCILHIIILILELIGLYSCIKSTGIEIKYYTIDSNLLALFSSILVLLYLKKQKPRIIELLWYMSVIQLTITFLVVVGILVPMTHFQWKFLLLEKTMLYYHLLCPVLSIITFLFFDEIKSFTKKESIKALSFTFGYSIIIVILNILRVVEGPYPFLMVYKQGVIVSIFWFVLILGLAYGISIGLSQIKNKIGKKKI